MNFCRVWSFIMDCDKTHLLSTGTLHKSTTFFAILNQAPKTQHMRASFWKHPIVPNHVTHDHTRQNPIMAESALSH